MGRKAKAQRKYGKQITLDRTLTAPESEAQAWERRTRADHQEHRGPAR